MAGEVFLEATFQMARDLRGDTFEWWDTRQTGIISALGCWLSNAQQMSEVQCEGETFKHAKDDFKQFNRSILLVLVDKVEN